MYNFIIYCINEILDIPLFKGLKLETVLERFQSDLYMYD